MVVIGGGDTGTDCVGTAMRQGCQSLVQIEILRARRWSARADNPWPEWPKVYRLDYGQEEAAAKFGADPRVYVDDRQEVERRCERPGEVARTVQVEVGARTPSGRFVPGGSARAARRRMPRSSFCWPWASSGRSSRCSPSSASNAMRAATSPAEHGEFATNVKGVFAAGDCRRGQSLVVWAINEGRGAARECDRYLMGTTDLP